MDNYLKAINGTQELLEHLEKAIHDIRTPLVTITVGINCTIAHLNKANAVESSPADFSKIIKLLTNSLQAGKTINTILDNLSNEVHQEMAFDKNE